MALATLEWLFWFNDHGLPGHIGFVPPAENMGAYFFCQEIPTELASLQESKVR